MNHIVALSGGKDSTAMALELREREPRPYIYVCTPTGNELPDMVAFWDELQTILDRPIIKVYAKLGLAEQIDFFKALPSNRMRWCTRMLKIEPYKRWLADKTPATSYVGLRADEERLGVVYDDQDGIIQDHPMQRWGWTIQDVVESLRKRGIKIPKRGDCAWCYDQRIGEWYELWRDHPALWAQGEEKESQTGHTFRSATRDSWPAAMRDLRAKFESGMSPKGVNQGSLDLDGAPYERCRVCRL